MFKHLLVPTDGSRLSTDTVARAVEYARETGARISFLYVKPEYPTELFRESSLAHGTDPRQFAEMNDKQAEQILSNCEAKAREAGVEFDTRSVQSDVPYQAIINTAAEAGCDLIFMASHGRRGFSALLLGSETHRVLTHSKIPVLVYR